MYKQLGAHVENCMIRTSKTRRIVNDFIFISSFGLDEAVIGFLLMAWPVLVGCVLAQVRPLSDSWQGIKLTAGLASAALLLSLF